MNSASVITSIVLYKHTQLEVRPLIDNLKSSDIVKKIVLVDNGGCDWAADIVQDKVHYIKATKNGGFGYGHNLAIKQYAHSSDYFLICNPDIDFDTQQLDKFYAIAQTLNAGLFSPKIIYPDGSNQHGQRLLPTPLNLFARRFLPKAVSEKMDHKYLLKAISTDKPVAVPYVSGSFMLLRSECLLELEGFDERYFMYMEDIDLSRRCAKKFGAMYIPQAYIVHEHQQASYKNKKLLAAHLRSAVQYFNKWGWLMDRERRQMNNKTLLALVETGIKHPV